MASNTPPIILFMGIPLLQAIDDQAVAGHRRAQETAPVATMATYCLPFTL
jgi:hypothetical protein